MRAYDRHLDGERLRDLMHCDHPLNVVDEQVTSQESCE